jgi:glycosyltransferase involved in cell wall biosynthesis
LKKPSKKILHILYSGQGGLGTYFINFVKSDQEQNFKHYAFFYGIEALNEELAEFCLQHDIEYCYQQKKSKIDFKALRAVLSYQKQYHTSYLLLHTFSLSLLTIVALFQKWKVVAIDHTSIKVKTKVELFFTLINHLFTYKMIYFYRGHFEQNKAYFPFLKLGKNSHIIPKNVDVNQFMPNPNRKHNKAFTLGTTARIIQGKRHDLIIKAVKKLKQKGISVHLKIAGDGPLKIEMEKLVDKLELKQQIFFEGLMTRNQIISFHQSLDAYIHASDGETICYSIMEAQACGLPILASDVEGINTNLSKKEGGILFKNNSESIANKIEKICIQKALLAKNQKLARNYAIKNYNENNNSKILYNIIK